MRFVALRERNARRMKGRRSMVTTQQASGALPAHPQPERSPEDRGVFREHLARPTVRRLFETWAEDWRQNSKSETKPNDRNLNVPNLLGAGAVSYLEPLNVRACFVFRHSSFVFRPRHITVLRGDSKPTSGGGPAGGGCPARLWRRRVRRCSRRVVCPAGGGRRAASGGGSG